jgi:hypothetical protein
MENQLIDQIPEPREPTQTEILQASVNKLGAVLLKQAQANGGQIDIISLQLNMMMLTQTMQLMTALIIELSNGKYTDDSITATVNERVKEVIMGMESQLATPKILRGLRSVPRK